MDRGTVVFLFGDQTEDIAAGLRELLDLGPDDDYFLQPFLARAYREIRAGLAKLAPGETSTFQRFSSIQDLAALHRHGQLHPALHPALACVYHLGSFIRRCGRNGALYDGASGTFVLGLGTGGLAAAAASCCRSLPELLPVAIHTVGVAFRLGFRVVQVGESIERHTNPEPVSWSMVVSGLTVADASQALEKHLQQHPLPPVSQPCITGAIDRDISIGGPPAVLRELQRTQLSGLTIVDSAIYAPYHNPRLFGKYDVECVLNTTSSSPWSHYPVRLPNLSSATGKLIPAANYGLLLQAVLEDILLRPIFWDDVVHGVTYVAGFARDMSIVLHSTNVQSQGILCGELKKRGYEVSISTDYKSVPASQHHGPSRPKIAIVGMSGRFPEAEDPAAFWDILSRGMDVHKIVPRTRWDVRTHVDVSGKKKNTSGTPFGCWLNNPGHFDAKFFNISPREAPEIDPAGRLALMTAYEAMEDAGMVPGATPSTQKDRVGVFYGVTSNDWMEVNSAQNIDTYFIAGGCRAFIPGRINYFFKFSGPSYSIDTACSSSLAAIHTACNALWQGDIDTAVAGGTNVLTNPDYTAGLDRGHFLSRTGNCKSFDDEADGYCRGEGIVTVILKRLDDAIADNDPIQGVIAGAYTNHSSEAGSITRPHIGAQKAIFQKILNDANVDAHDVSYVEMHGTGTQTGDPVEMGSVLETFAPQGTRLPRRTDQPLYLGSAKANIGHGEAAAGATSLAKVLLMLKSNTIPPHCGIKTRINHKFPTDLLQRNVSIASMPVQWPRPKDGIRRAFINNFSAAGGNSALLVEDPPPKPGLSIEDPRTSYIVSVSAKTPTSVRKNVESLSRFLESNPQISLPALSYTTTARRAHHLHRVVVSASSIAEVVSKLRQALDRGDGASRPLSPPKVTFFFAGNGSQYPGMGRQLFEGMLSFRAEILRLDQLVQSQGFPSIISMYSPTNSDVDDFSPVVVSLATVCLEIALARMWISLGIIPSSVAGHSLGEYAALSIAGVLSDSDTIYVVGTRAKLLYERCTRGTHTMLAVRASEATIYQHLAGMEYEVSCINGPDSIVISGTSEVINLAKNILEQSRLSSTLLVVPYAFHSAQVDPILESFEVAAGAVTFRKPEIPVLSALLSSLVDDIGTFGPGYLSAHCRKTVNMLGALQTAKQSGIITSQSVVIDIGPHPTSLTMIESTLGPHVKVLQTLKRNRDTWPIIATTLSALYNAGIDIIWREFHGPFHSCHKVLQLPAYNWDLKDYWIQYVNDWSLRKGDPLSNLQNKMEDSIAITSASTPEPESSTIHRILENIATNRTISIISETNLSHPDLHGLTQGHKVNQVPLCTPSVYADIALTLASYIVDRYQPHRKGCLLEIADLTIEHALIAHGRADPQLLRTHIRLDIDKESASCQFSNDKSNSQLVKYSHCVVHFRNKLETLQNLQVQVPQVKVRISELQSSVSTGGAYRFNQPMIYRMVATVAQFNPDYQALDQIILDSQSMEASAVTGFAKVRGGIFHTHPAFIDALTQTAGFIMNACDNSNLEEVFVNHGWKSFQLFEQLLGTDTYQILAKMHEKSAKTWEGDLLVLDNEKVIASFKGIVLQKIPKQVLYLILLKEKDKVTTTQSSSHPKQPQLPLNSSYSPRDIISSTMSSVMATDILARPYNGTTKPELPVKNKKAAENNQTSLSSEVSTKVLEIISQESGIAITELAGTSEFADLGIDSLLILQIYSRLKDDLGLDLNTSIFNDLHTINDLKYYLESVGLHPIAPTIRTVSAIRPQNTVTSAPAKQSLKLDASRPTTPHIVPGLVPQARIEQYVSTEADVTRGLQIISEESGVSISDLTDDIVFADIGIDSLMSLMILARYREELSLSLDGETTFNLFDECPTVRDLKLHLSSTGTQQAVRNLVSRSATNSSLPSPTWDISDTVGLDSETPCPSPPASAYTRHGTPPSANFIPEAIPPATSVILQGRLRSAAKTLILFPDGSGAATSYINIPNVREDLCIICLNCPYLRNPEEMNCTLDELMDSYLTEVRRRQPSGPYNIGGWSCGGAFAYRATQRLIQEGEEVETLALIDAPAPNGLDALPERWYNHCVSTGVFRELMPGTDQSLPKWLIPHFRASVQVLHDYHGEPLPAGFTPRTSIIWATECVTDGVRFPTFEASISDPRGVKFLTETRADFSAGQWSTLFPGDEPEVEIMDGANHFSMMGPEHSTRLAAFLDRATR